LGGVVGGIFGHNTQRLSPVQLEALPLCLSPSGDIIPVKMNLAINFFVSGRLVLKPTGFPGQSED